MNTMISEYKHDRDAFGHMLMDHFNGLDTDEIIEREDGLFDSTNGPRLYFSDFQDWPAWEQETVNHLITGRVLDLGCGAGRVEIYLQIRNTYIQTTPPRSDRASN
jgi:SAM-dependent methyltransferase